ncbi:MAG: thiamine pyrophosphate-binding protein, partial [Candidatus Neomarinimicrobiota bacterium]
MSSMRGGEAVVKLLRDVGVEVIFGLCGDTSLPFYDALASSDHGIRHVLTRDERSASFMADAYARLSGKVGVCEGPSGGGATYILPGVAEADASSVPLVCLTSDIDQHDAGRGTLTELDQTALFTPITRSTIRPRSARELVTAIGAAFRDATTGPLGAAHVVLPYDVQLDEVAA